MRSSEPCLRGGTGASPIVFYLNQISINMNFQIQIQIQISKGAALGSAPTKAALPAEPAVRARVMR